MAAPNLIAFQHDVAVAKTDLERFVKFYGDVWYRYYYSEPPIAVPDEMWHYITESDMPGRNEPDFAADGTACLFWEGTVGLAAQSCKEQIERFKLLCKQCCLALWDHKTLLATVAEIQTVVAGPSGYHQWICLIHKIAAVNSIWSGMIAKCLCISQRPFNETRKERYISEPNEAEVQLVRGLRKQGKSVPDIWSEQVQGIHPVVPFHCEMLDVLCELVQASYVSDLAEGDGLTQFQKKLIASLDGKKLATEALCTELSKRGGKIYGSSGQVKTALSNLVKLGVMKNDGSGYELTDLGRRIEAELPESIWAEPQNKRKHKPPLQ